MNYRVTQKEDWNEIIPLVNKAFESKFKMEDAFPLLFAQENNTSYVAVCDGKIVSFIGGVPGIYDCNGRRTAYVSIGAVCTALEYRNRGISDGLLKYALADYKNSGFGFALISGDRDLYLRNGFQLFGDIRKYEIKLDQELLAGCPDRGLQVKQYDGSNKMQLQMYRLYTQKGFICGFTEFKKLLEASAMNTLIGGESEILAAYEKDAMVSFLAASLKQDGVHKHGEIIEVAGELDTMGDYSRYLFEQQHCSSLEYAFNPSLDGELEFLKEIPYKKIRNQGSVLSFEEGIDDCLIPYTSCLSFV